MPNDFISTKILLQTVKENKYSMCPICLYDQTVKLFGQHRHIEYIEKSRLIAGIEII